MKYGQFLAHRKSTNELVLTQLQAVDVSTLASRVLSGKSQDFSKIRIAELGTTRSMCSWRIETTSTSDDPETWAWSDGCFTRVFAENIPCHIYSVDPCKEALQVAATMTEAVKNNVTLIQTTASEFLNYVPFKFHLIYMDHLESGEAACEQHLHDAKIIVERNLVCENGLILIDDTPQNASAEICKGLYSIPFLLENGYELLAHEYQAVLRRKPA